jgi:hypothetical protein
MKSDTHDLLPMFPSEVGGILRCGRPKPRMSLEGHFRLSCPPVASPFMSAALLIAALLSMDGCWSVSAMSGREQVQQLVQA